MTVKSEQTIVNAVSDLQAEIARWRVRVCDWHPTPPALETAAYLATEAGEALDAVLRRQRPGDDRTNANKDGLDYEIAQVLDMALTLANAYDLDIGRALVKWMRKVEERRPER